MPGGCRRPAACLPPLTTQNTTSLGFRVFYPLRTPYQGGSALSARRCPRFWLRVWPWAPLLRVELWKPQRRKIGKCVVFRLWVCLYPAPGEALENTIWLLASPLRVRPWKPKSHKSKQESIRIPALGLALGVPGFGFGFWLLRFGRARGNQEATKAIRKVLKFRLWV
jgi:hypothetical protein